MSSGRRYTLRAESGEFSHAPQSVTGAKAPSTYSRAQAATDYGAGAAGTQNTTREAVHGTPWWATSATSGTATPRAPTLTQRIGG